MTDPVKPRRRYRSATRTDQAAATRDAVIKAALHLFAHDIDGMLSGVAGLMGVARGVAGSEPDIGAIYRGIHRGRRENFGMVVDALQRHGPLRDGQSFTQYCLDLARAGAVNGWLYPFVHEENLDDPRSPRTLFRTDEDFLRRMPLTAQNLGIRTVADWATQEHESALAVQRATLDLRHYGGWRAKLRGARRRAVRLVRGRGSW